MKIVGQTKKKTNEKATSEKAAPTIFASSGVSK
jgi:hypothetical protein